MQTIKKVRETVKVISKSGIEFLRRRQKRVFEGQALVFEASQGTRLKAAMKFRNLDLGHEEIRLSVRRKSARI